LYAILEAKYTGELNPTVGPKTDLFIWRSGEAPTPIGRKSRKILFDLAGKLQPQQFKRKHRRIVELLPEVQSLHRAKVTVLKRARPNSQAKTPSAMVYAESEESEG
ncbi:hypothetical protein, partial [Candidatus Binatus sp.]|uniref:hypothetical protein n=1 Tax=Candidatus Binatus sp. TaxID=2811406 RepID=UPI003C932888